MAVAVLNHRGARRLLQKPGEGEQCDEGSHGGAHYTLNPVEHGHSPPAVFLGFPRSVRRLEDAVKQSGIFCYRGVVRRLPGDEAG